MELLLEPRNSFFKQLVPLVGVLVAEELLVNQVIDLAHKEFGCNLSIADIAYALASVQLLVHVSHIIEHDFDLRVQVLDDMRPLNELLLQFTDETLELHVFLHKRESLLILDIKRLSQLF